MLFLNLSIRLLMPEDQVDLLVKDKLSVQSSRKIRRSAKMFEGYQKIRKSARSCEGNTLLVEPHLSAPNMMVYGVASLRLEGS